MRRCLVIRKRLALRRRYKERVLKRRHLQLVNESELSEVTREVLCNKNERLKE